MRRRPRGSLLALSALLFAFAFSPNERVSCQTENRTVVALVVHKENRVTDISLKDAQSFFKLEKKRWPGGDGPAAAKEVVIFLRKAGSAEQETLLQKVFEMTADKLERYWVERVYQGEISSPPSTKATAQRAIKAVSQNVTALTCILLSEVTEDVKVLTIDGKRPGDPDYPLVVEK